MSPLYYLSICAGTGAVSVMALKAFGVAVKLTFAGSNQFTYLSTYLFAIIAAACIVIQMNYFNKALNTFPQSIVAPIYYVTFTTAVLTASFILFEGFNTTELVDITGIIKTIRLLCGFLVIFLGVYLLTFSGSNSEGDKGMVNTPILPRFSVESRYDNRSYVLEDVTEGVEVESLVGGRSEPGSNYDEELADEIS